MSGLSDKKDKGPVFVRFAFQETGQTNKYKIMSRAVHWEETKGGQGGGVVSGVYYEGRWLGKHCPDERTLEQRPDWSEDVSHAKIWRKRFPGRRNRKRKGSEVGTSLAGLRNSKKASVPGAEW